MNPHVRQFLDIEAEVDGEELTDNDELEAERRELDGLVAFFVLAFIIDFSFEKMLLSMMKKTMMGLHKPRQLEFELETREKK